MESRLWNNVFRVRVTRTSHLLEQFLHHTSWRQVYPSFPHLFHSPSPSVHILAIPHIKYQKLLNPYSSQFSWQTNRGLSPITFVGYSFGLSPTTFGRGYSIPLLPCPETSQSTGRLVSTVSSVRTPLILSRINRSEKVILTLICRPLHTTWWLIQWIFQWVKFYSSSPLRLGPPPFVVFGKTGSPPRGRMTPGPVRVLDCEVIQK